MKTVWRCLCLKKPYALPVFSYDFAVSGMLLGVKWWSVVPSHQHHGVCGALTL